MEGQIKPFCLVQFSKDARAGYRLVWRELSKSLKLSAPRPPRVSIAERSMSTGGGPVGDDHDHDADDKEVGVSYGFSIYAKICASLGLFVVYFITDVKPGLYPSERFVVVSYAFIVAWTLVAVYGTYFIGWRISDLLLRDFVANFRFAVVTLVVVCLSTYLSLGVLSTVWFVKERQFVHHIISSSFVRTPKSFQRRQMVLIFVSTIVFSCITEPVYLASSFISYITQQNGFLPQLDPRLFPLVKYLVILGCFCGSLMMGVATSLVAIFACFIISNIAKYTESLLSKQLNRISYRNTTDVHNPSLLARLGDYEQRLIEDYSCYSITMDWPALDARPPDDGDDEQAIRDSEAAASPSAATRTVSVPNAASLRKRAPRRRPGVDLTVSKAQLNQLYVRVAFGADALLFAYRNLIKNLNQVKDRLRGFEKKFGYFHLAQIYISGLITAQWVVFGLLQIRFSGAHRDDAEYELIWPDWSQEFVLRAVFSVVAFVVSNTIMFTRADRLSRQMAKMRGQLFRFNIELARCAIENHRTRGRVRGVAVASDRPELEQVWLLYDQAVRMSHKAALRLGSSMVYDKNCLMQIFFSEVSAVLVVIQLVDLYKFG